MACTHAQQQMNMGMIHTLFNWMCRVSGMMVDSIDLTSVLTFNSILHFSGRPFFQHTPEDTGVVAGSIAMLQCAGSGNPQPELTWWKVSGGGQPQLVVPNSRVIVR